MFRLLTAAIAAVTLLPQAYADDEKTNPGAHILQAEIALSRGEYRRAAEEYRKAAELGSSVEHAARATQIADKFGFNDEALRSAQRWLELDEDSVEALWFVGKLQLRAGDLRSAERSFRSLIEQGDREPDQSVLGLVQALADEDEKDTYKLIRALAKPYKDSAAAHYAVAISALSAGEEKEALERAQKASELEPNWLKPKLLYGRALLISGKKDEAIDYTARIIGDDPDPDPEARMELAILMLSVGRDDDALSQVNQVLLEQPSRSDALRLMAIINFQNGNFDAAWDDFDDLLATGRYDNDAFYYLARIADIRAEHEQAVALYSEVTSGSYAVTAQRRASALLAFQMEDEDAALQQLEAFGKSNPAFAIDMVQSRAWLLASLERYDESLAYYDEMLEFRPDDEGVFLGRAELLLRMGRLDDAIAGYKVAVKRWPDSATALNAYGYTLADRTDRYREAEKLIRKAIKIEPDNPAIIDSLGWVLHKRGKHEEALLELQRAYESFDDAEVAAHIVDVLHVLGRNDEALEFLVAAEARETKESPLLQDVRERLFPEAVVD
ncbi:MAG: tetratricopeptide repeat protein [Woeseiaceae bacterium]